MKLLFDTLSFLGAWMLVAGPVYQASLELNDQDIEMDRLRKIRESLPQPKKVSVWWWLLPPVKIYLSHKSNDAVRQAYGKVLNNDDLQAMFELRSKALGWVIVASGAALIACKETFELTEHIELPLYLIVLVIVVMVFLSLSYTVRSARRRQLFEERHGISKKK